MPRYWKKERKNDDKNKLAIFFCVQNVYRLCYTHLGIMGKDHTLLADTAVLSEIVCSIDMRKRSTIYLVIEK
jgi:hypothetical protein